MFTRVLQCLAVGVVCVCNPQATGQDVVEDPNIELFEMRSERLSIFYGRDVSMYAGIVVPPDREPGEHLPICLEVHGFGASHAVAWGRGRGLLEKMRAGGYPRMLYVYPNASFGQGHHVFADSVNFGPWATALVEEFLPAIEKRFQAGGRADARFLTGHSSGGWSSLWLQVTHPDVFGGTWSTAPDPVDFRDFSGINLYEAENVFLLSDGRERPYMETPEGVMTTRQAFSHASAVPQMLSFEAAFSPRGDEGGALSLFDRTTGVIDRSVVAAWSIYDIRSLLRRDWKTLREPLSEKLHVFVGDRDEPQLDGAVQLLRDELAALGSDAEIVIIQGRGHFDLQQPHPVFWPDGFHRLAHSAMRARYDAWRHAASR